MDRPLYMKGVIILRLIDSCLKCYYLTFTGNIIAGYILDRFGRKYTLLLASLPKLLGFLMLTYGNAVWMLYFGRSAMGLSDSLTFTVVPIYASEVASVSI